MSLEKLLKQIIKLFHLPSGVDLDSHVTLAVDHICLVWTDKLKRGLELFASILGIKYDYAVAKCSIYRLDKKLLLDISLGNLYDFSFLGSSISSNSLILPRFNKLHFAIAQNAFLNSNYGAFNIQGIPFDGAFFTRAGIFVHGIPKKILPPDKSSYSRIDTAFFVNELNLTHFGHSITDGLSSVLLLLLIADMRISPRIPIIINRQISGQKSDLYKIFEASNLNVLIPGENCGNLLVEHLVFPVPSMVNSGRLNRIGFVSQSHPNLVKKYLSRLSVPGSRDECNHPNFSKKIYISRSRLQENHRKFIDESLLEDELIRLGWLIFHPQEYSLSDQLNILVSAVQLCGIQGSALHLLLGIDPNPHLRVTIISPTGCNFNYTNQLRSQGVTHKTINCLEVAQGQGGKPPWLRNHQLISGWNFADLASHIDKF